MLNQRRFNVVYPVGKYSWVKKLNLFIYRGKYLNMLNLPLFLMSATASVAEELATGRLASSTKYVSYPAKKQ